MKLLVDKGEKIRLDVYLAAETEYTRSYIKQLVESGRVLLNGERPQKAESCLRAAT